MPEICAKKIGIAVLIVFYGVYITKMILQKRKGIQTDQIAKKKEKNKVFYVELVMKLATYFVVFVEVGSIFQCAPTKPRYVAIIGAVLAVLGDIIFAIAVYTMRDSWRAGIAQEDRTEMITNGIYSISRNPAFLGFDCVYVGLTLMFFNIPLLLVSLWAMIMLHLQILQEEQFLPTVFGEDYVRYRQTVRRYIGRRRGE